MMRKPRDAKMDRLVNVKLLVWSYLQIGVIEAVAAMFVWLLVWEDYGVKAGPLFGTAKFRGYKNSELTEEGNWKHGTGPYPADSETIMWNGVSTLCTAIRSMSVFEDNDDVR